MGVPHWVASWLSNSLFEWEKKKKKRCCTSYLLKQEQENNHSNGEEEKQLGKRNREAEN